MSDVKLHLYNLLVSVIFNYVFSVIQLYSILT